MVATTAFSARSGWSISRGIRWSVSRGIGGQFAPESGGQYQRILHVYSKMALNQICFCVHLLRSFIKMADV